MFRFWILALSSAVFARTSETRQRLLILLLIVVLPWLFACHRSSVDDVRVLRAVAPAFPQIMAQAHKEGEVSLKVNVDQSGVPREAKVIGVDGVVRRTPMNDEGYEGLALQWRFQATGRAREVEIHIVYELMPPDTPLFDLGTTFEVPATVRVRGAAIVPEPTMDYIAPK